MSQHKDAWEGWKVILQMPAMKIYATKRTASSKSSEPLWKALETGIPSESLRN